MSHDIVGLAQLTNLLQLRFGTMCMLVDLAVDPDLSGKLISHEKEWNPCQLEIVLKHRQFALFEEFTKEYNFNAEGVNDADSC